MTKDNSKAARFRRSTNAAERDKKHAALTPAQKIAKLDAKLGKGVGAHKERFMLAMAELDA